MLYQRVLIRMNDGREFYFCGKVQFNNTEENPSELGGVEALQFSPPTEFEDDLITFGDHGMLKSAKGRPSSKVKT